MAQTADRRACHMRDSGRSGGRAGAARTQSPLPPQPHRRPRPQHTGIRYSVGFIDRLPHALVAAFRATLEEVVEADLALHVIDAAAPDRERRMAAVRAVLEEVGALDVPLVDVYNKCDRLTPDEVRRVREMDPSALCISATTGEGVDDLVAAIASRVELDVRRVTLTFDPPWDSSRMSDEARLALNMF